MKLKTCLKFLTNVYKSFFILSRLHVLPPCPCRISAEYLSLWFDLQISVYVPLMDLLYNLLKCQTYLLGIIPMGKETLPPNTLTKTTNWVAY